jgi:GTP pyrophosphokinase
VIYESEKARLVPADWEPTDSIYPVSVEVKAWDRVGLIRDITTVVAEEKVNIAAVNFTNHEDYTTSTFLTLEVKDLAQLSRLLVRIEGVRAVIGVSRVGDEVIGKTGHKKKSD